MGSLRFSDKIHAQETAVIVVPTPPRLPMNAMTWPRPPPTDAVALRFSKAAASASRLTGFTT